MLPKQFVKLFNGESLFQITLRRNLLVSDESIFVVGRNHYFLALDQSYGINKNKAKTIIEPFGRNTAPAIALACFTLPRDEIVLVSTSDHLIKKEFEFKNAVDNAVELAKNDQLVTFGVEPLYAETGFGYIKYHGSDVLEFKEKPNKEKAKEYLLSGDFLWNSGMFCFKAGIFLDELKKYSPDIYYHSKDAIERSNNGNLSIEISDLDMKSIPSKSVDCAVMEHSNRVKVVACDMQWSDLGSFDSVYKEFKSNDLDENAIVMRSLECPKPRLIESKNNLIVANDRSISIIGVNDLHVVDTDDAILIAKKGDSEQIKNIVELLKKDESLLSEYHRKVYRPWGWYDNLEEGKGFKVKRIIVNPGKRLSLQKHRHRAEHWVVVNGTAEITCGKEVFLLSKNQSTYIPLGEEHRIANPVESVLEIVEIQSGEYLSEDDIERIEDDYGRDL